MIKKIGSFYFAMTRVDPFWGFMRPALRAIRMKLGEERNLGGTNLYFFLTEGRENT